MSKSEDNGEGSQQQQSSNDHNEPYPICSVLNTVIDYVMRPPCPLEDPEYHQAIPVEVPVLRVFGPILRRDTARELAVLPQPVQTACLFIHNAFPYILARPVAAGPDGSHYLPSARETGQVNWDSMQDIERVVPVLKETLEAAIQASFEINSTRQAVSSEDRPQQRMPVIRRVIVVEGRGFYTYCPGPSGKNHVEGSLCILKSIGLTSSHPQSTLFARRVLQSGIAMESQTRIRKGTGGIAFHLLSGSCPVRLFATRSKFASIISLLRSAHTLYDAILQGL
jgi:hypothetical protein